jgi:hypothetical protein
VIGRRVVAAASLAGEQTRDDVADERLHVGDHGFQRMAVIEFAGPRFAVIVWETLPVEISPFSN